MVPEFRAFATGSSMMMDAKNHARAALEMPDRFERQETKKVEEPDAYLHLTEEQRLE